MVLIKGKKTLLYDTGGPNVISQLHSAIRSGQLKPREVDGVIVSHLHWDHGMNVNLFPDSEIFLSKREFEYAKHPKFQDWATPYGITKLYQDLKLRFVEEGTELMRGVKVVDAPGHSPGLVVLEVETRNDVAILASDALFSAKSFLAGEPFLIFYSRSAARLSMTKIKKRGSLFYPGHDIPFRYREGKIEYITRQPIDLGVELGPYKNVKKMHATLE
ncbi:MAG: MBL fold metallo-hydrolase [Thermofilum sp.]